MTRPSANDNTGSQSARLIRIMEGLDPHDTDQRSLLCIAAILPDHVEHEVGLLINAGLSADEIQHITGGGHV